MQSPLSVSFFLLFRKGKSLRVFDDMEKKEEKKKKSEKLNVQNASQWRTPTQSLNDKKKKGYRSGY